MNSKVIKESSFQIHEEIKKLHERLLFKKNRLNEKEEEINFLNIEIEELKNQLTEFYDFNSSAFLTIDKNYSIQAVTFQSSLLMSYERNELINKNFFNFISTFQYNTLKKCIHDLIEKVVKQDCELELLVKGGTRKYIKIECLFTKDKLILLLLRDLTYVRQLESQQIQLNQSLGSVNQFF
ncbi:PAS domain-containing sensor histidine kinase [Legionella sp. PC1000]|uniref:hypothetical protein n=1 Tax=Legionella sp. PC1000 TaxID=2746060 RepID=UPI0015FB3165|nr:hypothetical protein [Legionella sp. PC1000]QLZ68174.1 PAS domain-containing sensor histidine kinase [Legionella sp. PC1000]